MSRTKTIISRHTALERVKKVMENYPKDGKKQKQNIVSIVAVGFSRKTTFLKNDVKEWVEEQSQFEWIYINCDSESTSYSRVYIIFELAEVLSKRGYSTPNLLSALKRYNTATKGVLKAKFGSRFSRMGESFKVISAVGGAVSELIMKAVNRSGRKDDDDEYPSVDELLRCVTARQIEDVLVDILINDLDRNTEKPLCIVYDGLEKLISAEGNNGRIPWLEKLMNCRSIFFILSGRRRLEGVKAESIELDDFSSKDFRKLLGADKKSNRQTRTLRPNERRLLEKAKGLPGILSLYADGIHKKYYKRDISYEDKDNDLLRCVAEKYMKSLQERNVLLWQVIAVASWLGEWTEDSILRIAATASIAFSEYIGEIKNLPFVEEMGDGGGKYRIHMSIASEIRQLTETETVKALIQEIEVKLV